MVTAPQIALLVFAVAALVCAILALVWARSGPPSSLHANAARHDDQVWFVAPVFPGKDEQKLNDNVQITDPNTKEMRQVPQSMALVKPQSGKYAYTRTHASGHVETGHVATGPGDAWVSVHDTWLKTDHDTARAFMQYGATVDSQTKKIVPLVMTVCQDPGGQIHYLEGVTKCPSGMKPPPPVQL